MNLKNKNCGHCGLDMGPTRKLYHPECLPAVRAAAQLAKRKCGRCKKIRAASSFVNDSTRVDGKYPWCIDCQKTGFQAGKLQSSDEELNGHMCPLCDTEIRGHKNRRFCSTKCKDRVAALRKKFGLNVEQYRKMVEATNGHCPLCNCRVRKWAVDHNHQTGLVTGVVCTACNVGILAASRHEPARAEALARYLASTPAEKLGIVVQVPEAYKNPQSNLQKTWNFKR